jgi:hypothetical protein
MQAAFMNGGYSKMHLVDTTQTVDQKRSKCGKTPAWDDWSYVSAEDVAEHVRRFGKQAACCARCFGSNH